MLSSDSTKLDGPSRFHRLALGAAALLLATLVGLRPALAQTTSAEEVRRIEVLFLGDDGHHEPPERLRQVLPEWTRRGLDVEYTDRVSDLNAEYLAGFDVLMIYGNTTSLPDARERDLLDFVHDGGGLVAVHSASAMFSDSKAYAHLVGGKFLTHGTGTFSTERLRPDHPAIEGVPSFESWDETYVHYLHNPDKTVLAERVNGDRREPWTWVRTPGSGRVFYTAWGHDERTWTKNGFHDLIEQGTRWAAGDWALEEPRPVESFTFVEGSIPYYPPDSSWGVTGEPITEVQEPLPPEESMRYLRAEPGFEVSLFASDPEIVNPIDLSWDAEGRTWVAETVDYPNEFRPNRRGRDRIKILEDTDGDGRVDETTVFADGLNIVTSLTHVEDGVLVTQAPHVLHLRDTNGDDRADERDTVLTGFGTFDTHAGPSSLRYGFDNRIWGVVGYSGFEGAVAGDSVEFAQSVFRFRSDGSRIEELAGTTNNTWGLGFTEEGYPFASTANDNPSVHVAIPNRYFESVRGWEAPVLRMIADSPDFYPISERIRQVDQHGRYTAGAGHSFYTARRFPERFWNRTAFVAGPTGHLLGEFTAEANGSGFVTRNDWNFLASRDEWTAPIQAKVGPDGALWVIDWYNLIIQHNPTPEGYERGEGNAYLNEMRDREHARIYRVTPKGTDAGYDPMSLADASPRQLVEALDHENMFWRLTAQRLLVERGESDVLSDLFAQVRDESVDELGLNPGAIHALWTIDGLGGFDEPNPEAAEVARDALYHPSAAVRRTAVRVLPRTERTLRAFYDAGLLPTPGPHEGMAAWQVPNRDDTDPKVRLETLLAVSEMSASEEVGRSVFTMLRLPDNAQDPWIPDAATSAGAAHAHGFLRAALDPDLGLPADRDSSFAGVRAAVQRVARHYAAGTPTDGVVDLLGAVPEADSARGNPVLEGLAEGWPEDAEPSLTGTQEGSIQSVRAQLGDDQVGRLDRLMARWGIQ